MGWIGEETRLTGSQCARSTERTSERGKKKKKRTRHTQAAEDPSCYLSLNDFSPDDCRCRAAARGCSGGGQRLGPMHDSRTLERREREKLLLQQQQERQFIASLT